MFWVHVVCPMFNRPLKARQKEACHETDVGAVGRGGHRTAAGAVVAELWEESGGAGHAGNDFVHDACGRFHSARFWQAQRFADGHATLLRWVVGGQRARSGIVWPAVGPGLEVFLLPAQPHDHAAIRQYRGQEHGRNVVHLQQLRHALQ